MPWGNIDFAILKIGQKSQNLVIPTFKFEDLYLNSQDVEKGTGIMVVGYNSTSAVIKLGPQPYQDNEYSGASIENLNSEI